MFRTLHAQPHWRQRGAHLLPLLLAPLAALAYRPLFAGSLRQRTPLEVQHWFYTVDVGTPLLALGLGLWLLWRRRGRLRALPRRAAPLAAAPFLLAGFGLFAWSQASGAAELLLPSLAANLLAWASATRGRAGARAVALPALAWLLGVAIPTPLRNELLWQLQSWTAWSAASLLAASGFELERSGIVLQRDLFRFTVIETCSGLRGIGILTLVALAVRELFAAAGARAWLLVALVPPLGFVLNGLRVAFTVWATAQADPASIEPGSADDTFQGVAVLVAGTLVLYTLGRLLARSRPPDPTAAAGPDAHPGAAAPAPGPRLVAAAGLLALLALSVAVPRLPRVPQLPRAVEVPLDHRGWAGRDLPVDALFHGAVPAGQLLHRRYEDRSDPRRPAVVELFVALDAPYNPSLLSPKLDRPGPGWSLDERRPARVWMLGRDAQLAIASRGGQRALLYSWRLRDEGVLRESARSLLALDAGPLRRPRRRAAVRLVTPLPHDGPVARSRAKQTLDRFVTAFGEPLSAL